MKNIAFGVTLLVLSGCGGGSGGDGTDGGSGSGEIILHLHVITLRYI